MPDSEETTSESTSQWLGEVTSPYGVSDEDGTLRQAENGKWRSLFGGHRTKRFVARPAPGNREVQIPRTSGPDPNKPAKTSEVFEKPKAVSKGSLSSLIMGQTILAMAMVLGIVYVSKSHFPAAVQLKSFLNTVYHEDYSKAVVPTIEGMIRQLHLSAKSAIVTSPSTATLGASHKP